MKFARFALLALALSALSVSVGACAEAGSDDDDDDIAFDGGGGNGDGGGGQCANCGAGSKCCGGFCTDTQTNRNNCGECNNVCDEVTANGCSTGMCVCNFGPACSGGSTCCDTGCKNLDTDPQNCGLCGRPCGPMETCQAGECVCAATGGECTGATSCCSTGCVDTSTDTQNCGTCGMACDAGDVCAGGACDCAFTCPPPLPIGSKVTCCGDGCYDICSDPAHCGGCAATTCSTCSLGGCDDGPPDLLNCFFPSP